VGERELQRWAVSVSAACRCNCNSRSPVSVCCKGASGAHLQQSVGLGLVRAEDAVKLHLEARPPLLPYLRMRTRRG
jgi:hypothetical protein